MSKGIVCLLLLVSLGGSRFAEAQQSTRVVKVGELLFRDPARLGPGRQSFRRQLYDLGYVEGKTIVYETRSATGYIDRFHSLAGELTRLKVDVMFASSTTRPVLSKPQRKQSSFGLEQSLPHLSELRFSA